MEIPENEINENYQIMLQEILSRLRILCYHVQPLMREHFDQAKQECPFTIPLDLINQVLEEVQANPKQTPLTNLVLKLAQESPEEAIIKDALKSYQRSRARFLEYFHDPVKCD
jgi:hypothetical protein